ncbi:MAG: acyl-CoA dehydrogenase family protein, partial [Rhodococcus sp. (in: high G+C Gram-positive bacteria)]
MKRTIFEPEHEQFREAVRAFLIKEAVPHSDEWEEAGMVDRDFWRRAAAQGLVGFAAPEEFGGGGLRDFRFNAVLNEEVVRTGTVGDGFSLTNDIVLPYFLDLADEAQQKRWLPGIVSGERTIAVSMSEPGTG